MENNKSLKIDFASILKDIKKLNYEAMDLKEKRIIDNKNTYQKSNQKMPLPMLKGIRNKKIQKYKKQKEENKTSGVLYDSSQKKIDMSWYEDKIKKVEKNKKKGEYGNYRFKGTNKKGFGNYSKGVLSFSNKEIKKIQGK